MVSDRGPRSAQHAPSLDLATRLEAAAAPLRRVVTIAGFHGTEPGRVRLHTLAVLRWVAVVGQLFTILFVDLSLGIDLPLPALLPAVLLSALINVWLVGNYHAATRLSERGAALLFAFDIVQLCWLLALTGGLKNPFVILLLLPVTLAATTLGFATVVAVTGLALIGATVLALVPVGLPWKGGTIELPALYVLASWTALSTATVLLAIFAWNIAEEARRHADALGATQAALAREQQLSALGGQAAAAAHYLGSPLGTIAVIARELVRELPPDGPLAEEARELLTQAQRCREVLATLGRRPDSAEHRRYTEAPVSSLLEAIAADCARPGVEVMVEVTCEDDVQEPEIVAAPELRHALANLIDNAIQFARSEVRLSLRASRAGARLVIEDDGPGFAPEVLDWLGEPYVSTRQETGGLGLGVFIAITLLARTGASLHFDNGKKGACVTITWPPQALERSIEEYTNGRRHG